MTHFTRRDVSPRSLTPLKKGKKGDIKFTVASGAYHERDQVDETLAARARLCDVKLQRGFHNDEPSVPAKIRPYNSSVTPARATGEIPRGKARDAL